MPWKSYNSQPSARVCRAARAGRENRIRRAASLVSRVGPGRPPLTRGAAVRAAGDVQHRALVADEQAQQFDEPGAVKPQAAPSGVAWMAIGSLTRATGSRCSRPSSRRGPRAPARRAAPCPNSRGAACAARRETPDIRRTARRAARRPASANTRSASGRRPTAAATPPRAPARPARLYARAARTRSTASGRWRTAQALHQQLVSELGEPIFDGCIEILDRLEDGERDNAMHHGARKVASPPPCETHGRTSLHGTTMAKTPSPDVSPPIDEKRASFEREALVHLDVLYRVALRLSGNPPTPTI